MHLSYGKRMVKSSLDKMKESAKHKNDPDSDSNGFNCTVSSTESAVLESESSDEESSGEVSSDGILVQEKVKKRKRSYITLQNAELPTTIPAAHATGTLSDNESTFNGKMLGANSSRGGINVVEVENNADDGNYGNTPSGSANAAEGGHCTVADLNPFENNADDGVNGHAPVEGMNIAEVENNADENAPGGIDNATGGANKKCSRKRIKLGRKREEARDARVKGKEYTNYKGKKIPAKTCRMEGILCTNVCPLKCSEKFVAGERKILFEQFQELSIDAKNSILFKCMEPFEPLQPKVGAKRKRKLSFRYYVTLNGSRKQVCKSALQTLLQIGRGKLDHIQKQVASGTSVPQPDQRGRHAKRPNKLTEVQVNDVKEHIKLFPAEPSHYSRNKNPNRLYLSPSLSITAMYDLYKMWCIEKQKIAVTSRQYHEIFVSRFNLGFKIPRSDTCAVCDSKENTQAHDDKWKHAFEVQKKDKATAVSNDGEFYITFDLQKTLPLPKLSTSVAFYLRQVWLYNLGIHLIGKESNVGANGKAFFHIWTEADAGRSSEEIGSCILTFLDVSEIRGGHLVAWSDSCAGQNKNFFILCLWQYLILSKRFLTIDHKFPEPGHSFLDSDRDFAHIEKKIKKEQNIFSVDKYTSLMVSSNKTSPPEITRMEDKIFELKTLPEKLQLIARQKNVEGEKVQFQKHVRWIRVEEFGKYKYKHSHTETEEWKVVDVTAARKAKLTTPPEFLPKPKTVRKIDKKKWDDIQKQIP